jgi:hypothetical protein
LEYTKKTIALPLVWQTWSIMLYRAIKVF